MSDTYLRCNISSSYIVCSLEALSTDKFKCILVINIRFQGRLFFTVHHRMYTETRSVIRERRRSKRHVCQMLRRKTTPNKVMKLVALFTICCKKFSFCLMWLLANDKLFHKKHPQQTLHRETVCQRNAHSPKPESQEVTAHTMCVNF